MSFRFLTGLDSSFLSSSKLYSVVGYTTIYSSAEGHLVCFQVWAMMNGTVKNFHAQGFV